MPKAYPNLFSPFTIANLTLKNRLVMAPMSTEMGGLKGEVTPRMIAFYRERALGGMGLIVVEYTCVGPDTGRANKHQLTLETRENLDGHFRLVNAIHEAGAHIFMQLQHSGQFSTAAVLPSKMPAGPSDVFNRRDPSKQTCRAFTSDEVSDMVEAFGRTAELAVEAGYDGVELHGAHGYLLSQFLSPLGNKREDQWGGSFENRLRFPLEVIQRVKTAIGGRPLCYRISADEFKKGGLTIEDIEKIVPHLVAAGVDVIHCSTGWGTGPAFATVVEPMSTPEGWRIPYAKRVKDASALPVIAVGQIRWPEMAEEAIASGQSDLIALGRPMLTDPQWANKAQVGRRDLIRPCTSCNWCLSAHESNTGVGCAENPRTGFELDPVITDDLGKGRKAVVVGAGPGGIAAALLLNQAGFSTSLYEKRPRTGGGIIASATPPGKDKLFWYNQYLQERLSDSTVELYLDTKLSQQQIIALNPDIVFLTTGTAHRAMKIPGIDSPMVKDAYDVLMGEQAADYGKNDHVIVYGGGETGCESAEFMADKGAKVTLITRSLAKKLARSAEWVYRMGLLQRISDNPLITVLEQTTISAIKGNSIEVTNADGENLSVDGNCLLIAQGRKSDNSMASALVDAGIACSLVGDSQEVGRIGDAVHMAYKAVMALRAQYAESNTMAC